MMNLSATVEEDGRMVYLFINVTNLQCESLEKDKLDPETRIMLIKRWPLMKNLHFGVDFHKIDCNTRLLICLVEKVAHSVF